ncbi:MAG: AbgT family transporter [Lachnospiraceae bacterium]
MEKKKKFEVPHTMIIMFGCIVFVAILTYILPAGIYERMTNEAGTTIIDPNSYHVIDASPVSFFGLFASIAKGFSETASIIMMTFACSAAVMVLRRIEVIDAAIEFLAKKFENKGVLAIPVLMLIFAMIDSFIGMSELCIIYLPIIMPLIFRLGFDSMTAMAVVSLGTVAGFTAALTNPYTTAISQKMCELPLYSGWEYRLLIFAVLVISGSLYVMRYAKKITANPEASPVYVEDQTTRLKYTSIKSEHALGLRQKLSGFFAVGCFVFVIYGIIAFSWDIPEMSGMFLIMGVGAGIISGMKSKLTIIGMFLLITMLNFFVSSGSGKAVILMPILAPLADLCGITRQTAILAYQFGDGFTNKFWPTNGLTGACLGMAGISYGKWARFYLPVLGIWCVFGGIFLVVAQMINYGPF